MRPPVATLIPQYSTVMTSKRANHCIKECHFSKLTVLNVGCKKLINELKEYKLINRSIVIVKKIIFEHKDKPRSIPYELPVFVIIEFKESTFAQGTKWRTNLHQKPPFVVIKRLYFYIYSIKSL